MNGRIQFKLCGNYPFESMKCETVSRLLGRLTGNKNMADLLVVGDARFHTTWTDSVREIVTFYLLISFN